MLIVESGLKVECICRKRKRSHAAGFMLLQFDSEAFEEATSKECKKDSSAILLVPYIRKAAGMLGGVVANRTP
jgi:hypothetical protein